MYSQSEGYFSGYQDTRLYYQIWKHPKSKGNILITHGQGEHSGSYQRLIDGLFDSNFSFTAWDWRGHGKSDGLRGYAHHFNDYCHDFEVFFDLLKQQNKEFSSMPLVLLAHSMGGLIQLKSILSHPRWQFDGQILSAPLLKIAVDVPAYKELAARVLVNTIPKMTLWNEIPNSHLSRDPEIIKEYEKDVLRHDRISAGVYLGSMDAMQFVSIRASKIQSPTLLQLAGQDKVVSTPTAEKFFQQISSPQKILKIYPDSEHEIYNDLEREQAYQDIRGFLGKF